MKERDKGDFMSKKNEWIKLPKHEGIYKHKTNGKFRARKKVAGKSYEKVCLTLRQAKAWKHQFNGKKQEKTNEVRTSKLKEVWETMQSSHFPTLQPTTIAIWHRRYGPWKTIENLPMEKIIPSTVTKWVNELAEYYRSEYYQSSGRGRAGRCNLNNELNLFVTIFNWYKESEEFEHEAQLLTCPIKKKHRTLGFIKPVPDKIKQISLEDALTFFEYLQPLYRSLAMMQYFTAGRVGEVAGIQWKNVDLKNQRLIIKETCVWDMSNKTFMMLKPFPKNKEPRICYIPEDMKKIFLERKAFKKPGCDYVFHVEGKPLNYCTIQLQYREAQRKGKLPYSGTHILRHGMAKLARKVGGLDAVIAMTGHKDLKLADHYSKCNEDDQREVSKKIFDKITEARSKQETEAFDNVLSLSNFAKKV
jgi:integrase